MLSLRAVYWFLRSRDDNIIIVIRQHHRYWVFCCLNVENPINIGFIII